MGVSVWVLQSTLHLIPIPHHVLVLEGGGRGLRGLLHRVLLAGHVLAGSLHLYRLGEGWVG